MRRLNKPRGKRRPAQRVVLGKPWAWKSRLGTILLILVVLLLVGALPTWGHSRSWGYYPSGGLGTILAIVIVLMLLGYVHI